MGDNRDNSFDSRFWGTVPMANVKGTASSIWWSSGEEGIRWNRLDTNIR
jgi:signal peptidase I